MQSKVASYLGLARRAGKLTLGVFAVSTLKKCLLLVADESAGVNSKKEMAKLQKRFGCPLLFTDGLGKAVGKEGCVLAAVREAHLAEAIEQVFKDTEKV